MPSFRWSAEKNRVLAAERGITFEQIVVALAEGGALDAYAHPNASRYPNQWILVVECDSYAYLVPYDDDGDALFLKTAIPSRKATRDYLKGGEDGP